MDAFEQYSPMMIVDLVLVNQLVGGVDGRVRRALAVFDDRDDFLA